MGGNAALYVVEILVRESVTLNFTYTIDEQGTCRTHETTRGRCRERLLERAEEGMGIERWILVRGRVWRCLIGRRLDKGSRAGRRR